MRSRSRSRAPARNARTSAATRARPRVARRAAAPRNGMAPRRTRARRNAGGGEETAIIMRPRRQRTQDAKALAFSTLGSITGAVANTYLTYHTYDPRWTNLIATGLGGAGAYLLPGYAGSFASGVALSSAGRATEAFIQHAVLKALAEKVATAEESAKTALGKIGDNIKGFLPSGSAPATEPAKPSNARYMPPGVVDAFAETRNHRDDEERMFDPDYTLR